jgi:hypothetical protein
MLSQNQMHNQLKASRLVFCSATQTESLIFSPPWLHTWPCNLLARRLATLWWALCPQLCPHNTVSQESQRELGSWTAPHTCSKGAMVAWAFGSKVKIINCMHHPALTKPALQMYLLSQACDANDFIAANRLASVWVHVYLWLSLPLILSHWHEHPLP